jgi:hypothetical protein
MKNPFFSWVLKKVKKNPKCQFCGLMIGEGFKHQELYVCVECWTLLTAIIEDSFPMTMLEVGDKAEKAIQDRPLKPYHYGKKETE